MTIAASGALYLTQTRRDRRLDRGRIQLLWIGDAQRGLADIAAGRTQEADDAIGKIQQRRDLAASAVCPATQAAGSPQSR